jgi:hypothetical protein
VSISAVSSTSGPSQTDSQSNVNLLRQSFKQLASSLQSGDLAGAQKALSALERLVQSNQSASQTLNVQSTSTSTQNSTIQNDVAALGQALNFGDLSAAQSDFSRLVKDLRPEGQNGATASPAIASSQNPTGGTVSLYA